jgi:hypothetical protein
VGIFGKHETRGYEANACTFEHLHLFDERGSVDHAATAKHIDAGLIEHAGGNQVQHMFHAADDQGVAGIGATTEAHHHVGFAREHVDNLALAFVTPLTTNHDCCGHQPPHPGSPASRAPAGI